MRTLFAAILVAFTVSASSASFAAASIAPATETTDNGQRKQTASDAVTFAIENSKMDVMVQATESAKITIRIKDSFGHNIATKTLSGVQSGTRVRFDLSQLEDGLYHVSVWDGKNRQKQDIELKTVTPAVATQEVTFI